MPTFQFTFRRLMGVSNCITPLLFIRYLCFQFSKATCYFDVVMLRRSSQFQLIFRFEMVICELRNKSDVLMKQGDMKKLRSQLEEFWKHPEGLEIFFAPKTSLHIRRFTSRDKTIVTAYSNDANVLVFSVNELWIPSLQTVWDLKLTSLLTFEVPNNVLHILKRGADLMAPGVCNYESLDRSC